MNNDQKKFSSGAQRQTRQRLHRRRVIQKRRAQGGVAGQDASRGNPFPQGAVQEFRVITQNFKAEYQKAASAIITATTKSGGNMWEATRSQHVGKGSDFVARDPIAVGTIARVPTSAASRLAEASGATTAGPDVLLRYLRAELPE